MDGWMGQAEALRAREEHSGACVQAHSVAILAREYFEEVADVEAYQHAHTCQAVCGYAEQF